MPNHQEQLKKCEVDVVVADEEDICRAAAVSALKRFGFVKVHEAESGDEALVKITSLQITATDSAPVLVFLDPYQPGSCGLECARQICALFTQRHLPREPFLICASSRRISHQSPEHDYFHCSMPKMFETSKLASCFHLCRQWTRQGGGKPGNVPLQLTDGSRQPAAQGAPFPAAAETAPATPPSPETPTVVPARSGNSLPCLECLLPPRSPFEDVSMICLVGRGSFGRVFRARWDASIVALKVVEHYDQGKPAMMAFEGALSASLAHPNLVQTFKYSVRDTGTDGERKESRGALRGFEVWIVQEWCSLGTLTQKLCRKEILDQGGFPEVIEVCAEIGSAASYLHSRGIIHGDLTSSNVLLVERSCKKGYTTKISDFGLARVLDNGASGINTATMGTVSYMPPELFQLEGGALTKKVDVYAFGVILWQLCTGETPFNGLQPTQVVVMVARGAALQLPPIVPEALSELFKQSTARKPADRPGFDRIVQDLLAIAQFDT